MAPAWHGQNLRDIVTTLGYDIDRPWRELSRKVRDWLLFTTEQPTVPVYAGYDPDEVARALKKKEEPSYMGTSGHPFAVIWRGRELTTEIRCAACGHIWKAFRLPSTHDESFGSHDAKASIR